jgi:SagB-type dehydrogenase family enzyme
MKGMDIELPDIRYEGTKSMEECIYLRESIREFSEKDIEVDKISYIFWAAQGKKEGKRTVPSAGATYPLEIYTTIKNEGFFHYKFEDHILKQIKSKDISKELTIAALNQSFIYQAPVNIIICANFKRTTERYGLRGERYIFIEVGHCAQNIHLEAVSKGLISVPIGAFEDKEVAAVMGLPENIRPLYIIPIGYSKK